MIRVNIVWAPSTPVEGPRPLLMEKMPYQPQPGVEPVVSPVPSAQSEPRPNDWRTGLPELAGSLVTLRELRTSDAASLFTAMTNDEVTRFISPPPATVEGFERFIAWTLRQRAAGQSVSFAIVERGSDVAIGLFQVRSLDVDFATAEWGFAIGCEFWGTGMFVDGARLAIEFAFDVIGVHRLEARAAVTNTPRQRRAQEARRGARGRAAQVVPAARRVPRSVAVDDSCRRVARRPAAGRLSGRPLASTSHPLT